MYQGQRAFPTENPGQLRTTLLRQTTELEKEFRRLDTEKPSRWNVVRVLESSYQAKHGDMVLAGFNADTVVRLPFSSRSLVGFEVRVVQVAGLGAVTVAASDGETINGVPSSTIGIASGHRDYVDAGDGTWWGPTF